MPTMTDLRAGPVPCQLVDPEVVRVMTSPNDLWVGNFWEFRGVEQGGHATFLFDLGSSTRAARFVNGHQQEGGDMNPNPNPNQ